MIRVLIVSDTPDWCFAERAKALTRYAPANMSFTTATGVKGMLYTLPFAVYDVVLAFRPNAAGEIRRLLSQCRSRIPLVGCYNSGVGRPGHSLPELMVACDYVIVNNFAAWNEWRGRCLNFNACNISNGVDLEVFRPINKPIDRDRKVLWTASREKADSEDDIKGYRRIIRPLERVLPSKGLETDFLIPDGAGLDADGMAHWYATGGIYVQTSKSEGTPNTLLEAMACGLAVVTSNVGNVPELIADGVNGLVVQDWQTIPFFEAIQKAAILREELAFNALRSIISWDWRLRVEWYYAVLRKVAAGEQPEAFTYLDTSPDDV